MSARRRIASPSYVVLVCIASCNTLCPKSPLAPEICVTSRGANAHGDLVMAAAPPTGTTVCRSTSPVAGTISATHGTDVSRSGLCATGGDPWAELATNDSAVRVCMFFSCNPGTTNVFDCYETSAGDSRGSNEAESQKKRDMTHVVKGVTDSGFTGCCRTGKGRVTAQVQCSGIFAAKVEGYLWIEATDSDSHDYSVTYGVN